MPQEAPATSSYPDRVNAPGKGSEGGDPPRHGFAAATLLKLRTEAGMSRQDLAQAVGTNRVSLALAEKGRTAPRWSTIVRLSRVLKVDISVFVDDHEAT